MESAEDLVADDTVSVLDPEGVSVGRNILKIGDDVGYRQVGQIQGGYSAQKAFDEAADTHAESGFDVKRGQG